MQKPLDFSEFKALVTPHSKDFVQILESRSAIRSSEKSRELYKNEESFGRVIAGRAEQKLREEEATRDELAKTAIKSEEQIQEELILEQVRAFKESAKELAVAQFIEKLLIVAKQRMEARREFLRDVRYVELSASMNRSA